jgi:hypothetical protein
MINNNQKEIINHLIKNNGYQYNLLKASEECQELGLILTQLVLKPNKVTQQNVIDEIGDVIIRLEILKGLFPIGEIEKRIDFKLSNFKDWIDHKKYTDI